MLQVSNIRTFEQWFLDVREEFLAGIVGRVETKEADFDNVYHDYRPCRESFLSPVTRFWALDFCQVHRSLDSTEFSVFSECSRVHFRYGTVPPSILVYTRFRYIFVSSTRTLCFGILLLFFLWHRVIEQCWMRAREFVFLQWLQDRLSN